MPAPPKEWTFVLLNDLPVWTLSIVGAVALSIIVLAWLSYRRLPLAGRVVLTGIRTLAVGAVVLLVLQVGVKRAELIREKSVLAVLVDTSASMRLKEGKGKRTRLERAARWIKANEDRLNELGRDHEIRRHAFACRLSRALSPQAVTALRPIGSCTDIGRALSDLSQSLGS